MLSKLKIIFLALNIIKKIIDTGIDGEQTIADRQTIQFTNAGAILRIASLIPFILLYVIINPSAFWPLIIVHTSSILLLLLTFHFNATRQYLIASVWANIMVSLSVFINLWFFFGNLTSNHFFFILFALFPIITIPRKQKCAIVAMLLMNLVFFTLILEHKPIYDLSNHFTAEELTLFRIAAILLTLVFVIGAFYIYQQVLYRSQQKLEANSTILQTVLAEVNQLATLDALTRLWNRRSIEERLQIEITSAKRYSNPLSMIMFDLDRFKHVNDTLGHDTGDEVLKRIAGLVKTTLRGSDIFGRWGGEEFLVILPQTSLEGALLVAEKIRQTMETYWHDQAGVVTASFGVAALEQGENSTSFWKRVDNALYRAKTNGRNLVSVSIEDQNFSRVLAHIEWVPEWETGDQKIDQLHCQVLDYANKFLDYSLTETPHKAILATLEDFYTLFQELCSYEEEILRQDNYPDLGILITEHQAALRSIQSLISGYQHREINPVTLYCFITDQIVVGHLINSDMKYFPYLETQTRVG